MVSSYSTDLKLELMVTGENAGTWGDITNTNLVILQQAIAGYQTVALNATTGATLTFTNGALSNGKNAVIELTGTITGNVSVIIPDGIEKTYLVKNGTSGAYTVQIKTQTGCITVDTQYIRTYKKIDIYVPTVFTPNGDGLNDYLRPLLLGFNKINYFKIYNRWGKLLYSTTNDIPGWDGRVNNIPQEPQTIVWIIEAIDIDGGLHKQSGTTIILP